MIWAMLVVLSGLDNIFRGTADDAADINEEFQPETVDDEPTPPPVDDFWKGVMGQPAAAAKVETVDTTTGEVTDSEPAGPPPIGPEEAARIAEREAAEAGLFDAGAGGQEQGQ
jgi:hypothetical protein